jgi:hypothetical protein
MPHGKSIRFAMPLLVVCGLLLLAVPAQSQDSQSQQSQSVADAARRAREDKKNASKPAKVITDEDIDKMPKPGAEGLNVGSAPKLETEPPSPAAVAADQAADQAAISPPKTPGESPEIAKLKEKIALAKKELDLDKRELSLDQDTYYSQVDYVHDTAGQAKLAAEQQQINDKQIALEELKARLTALGGVDDTDKAPAADQTAPAPTSAAPPIPPAPAHPQP